MMLLPHLTMLLLQLISVVCQHLQLLTLLEAVTVEALFLNTYYGLLNLYAPKLSTTET